MDDKDLKFKAEGKKHDLEEFKKEETDGDGSEE